VWKSASPQLIDRWLRPALKGELHDAYAVTEAEAGSDPSGISTVAHRTDDGGYVLNGEKWFVTYGSVAAVIVVMANVVDGDQRLPTLFAVPADAPGVSIIDDPPFTHAYPHGHPTMRFADVRVSPDDVIGGVGEGDDLQRMWFTEERIGIAARCIGAMQRLITETTDWAINREQGGARLIDHQGVSFPLADSAADAAAGRLMVFDIAALKFEMREHIRYLPGALEFLDAVRGRGKRLLLTTNAHPISLGVKNRVTGLERHFDELVSSHEFGVPKEQARFWTLLARSHGVDPASTLFVDDSAAVLEAARQAGVGQVCQVLLPDSTQPLRAPLPGFAGIRGLGDLVP